MHVIGRSGANRTLDFAPNAVANGMCTCSNDFLSCIHMSERRKVDRGGGFEGGGCGKLRRSDTTMRGRGSRKIHRISQGDSSNQFSKWVSSQFSVRRISFAYQTASANEIDSVRIYEEGSYLYLEVFRLAFTQSSN